MKTFEMFVGQVAILCSVIVGCAAAETTERKGHATSSVKGDETSDDSGSDEEDSDSEEEGSEEDTTSHEESNDSASD